eukprot:TRINITY_DN4859_c0_g2_i1.p1 TRINITY_DN4859_c0_g2~~TRINITY_DN4859_c0_g2_i1.p1  ORF type:complete len:434 (-),score=94.55 TRINITY_DN4859_c0_g2_i1:295-1596(-)
MKRQSVIMCALHVCLFVTLAAFGVATVREKPTLVLLDSTLLLQTHSIYFKSLQEKGHTLDYWVTGGDSELKIKAYEEYIYDNIILFAPSASEYSSQVNAQALIDFVDSGRNLLIAADPSASDSLREIAKTFGARLLDTDSYVTDHFNFASSLDTGDHTVLAVQATQAVPVIFSQPKNGILFEGIGHTLDSRNKWATKLLQASDTAYSVVPGSIPSGKIRAGSTIALMSALQARNNARVVIIGSLSLFSNRFFEAKVSDKADVVYDNKDFALQVTDWTFKDRGLLRTSNLRHYQDDLTTPALYTVKQDLHASVTVHELVNGEWVPYKADNVQMEFQMLDPYVRLNMNHNDQGNFTKTFQIPDVYGVFTLKVNHHRLGYTWFTLAEQVTVRPYRHDQFERFIVSAFPYYAGNFSMMVGFFLFGVFFLYQGKTSSK